MGPAKNELTSEDHRKRLHDIVAGTRTVMLLTHGPSGAIDGRPMGLVKTEADTTMYLVTSVDSKKADELRANPRASVSVQNRDGFAMLDCEVYVSQDRKLIDELWEDSWKVWFSEGKDDPTIGIIVCSPLQGTYWNQDVATGLSYLYRMVKARLSGEEMEVKPGDQAKVDFH